MRSATQITSGTTAEWQNKNPVLPEGALAVEVRTNGKTRIRAGDGARNWSALDYLEPEGNANAPIFYNVSFKLTAGQDYLTFNLTVNTPSLANEISGNAAFANITIAQFVTAMKTYFPSLNTANKVVTIGGASGYWGGAYVNHISLVMVNSTVTLRLSLNTSNSAYTFDLPNGANPPQFAANVSRIN